MFVLIDHYDSFSGTIAYYCRQLGATIWQVNYDEVSIPELVALKPQGIIFSPGPGHPAAVQNSIAIAQYFKERLPLLGICLGHQMLGSLFGARVVRAAQIKHGKLSAMLHQNGGLFYNLPSPLQVTRYHSLILSKEDWPACLNLDAWVSCDDGTVEVMAFSHQNLPIYGWQFHPEALLTECGAELLSRFLNRCDF